MGLFLLRLLVLFFDAEDWKHLGRKNVRLLLEDMVILLCGQYPS